MHKSLLMILVLAVVPLADAATPAQQLAELALRARADSSGFAGFSAARGDRLFHRRGADWSCASCHTADPRAAGRHAVTGKQIAPLAPAANPQRFTDPARTAKWFKRNCRDVLGRECTPTEQGDLLTWLLTLTHQE